jgi:hypothetical protein
MSRKQLGKPFGRMRRRALVVGVCWLAGAGLATAVWATQSGDGEDPAALARTLRHQKIRDGVRIAAADAVEQKTPGLTEEEMIAASARYETELSALVAHAEQLRMDAYHARDLIRLAFIDDRMAQLRLLVRVVTPYFGTLEAWRADTLPFRSRYNLIQQAIERARELVSEMEKAFGENMETIGGVPLPDETVARNADDPTRPQSPDPNLDRPPEASSYR